MTTFFLDGAEDIAFWVDKGDEDETWIPVTFDELEELKDFLETNFPGLYKK